MKLPSLVRRMSVQDAREASLQERGPRNEFERRILQDALPSAKESVEAFYGTRLNTIPWIVVSNRAVQPDAGAWSAFLKEMQNAGFISEQKRLDYEEKMFPGKPRGFFRRISLALESAPEYYHAIRISLRNSICYNPSLGAIHIPGEERLRYPLHLLQIAFSHELTHHMIWERRSPLYSTDPLPLGLQDKAIAFDCANEGLALYCIMPGYEGPDTGFLARTKKLPFILKCHLERAFVSTFVHPQILLCNIAHLLMFSASIMLNSAVKLCRRNLWDTPDKLAKAVKKSFMARMAVNEYSDGFRFVKSISAALGGPKEAFKAITEKPPETMQEVLLPEKYLSRIKTA